MTKRPENMTDHELLAKINWHFNRGREQDSRCQALLAEEERRGLTPEVEEIV